MTEMRDVDHTHPHTGEAFGEPHAAGASEPVAADGGVADGADGADDRSEEMRDVDHESPGDGSETGANRAFERGTEGRRDTV